MAAMINVVLPASLLTMWAFTIHGQPMNSCNQASSQPGCFDTTCSAYICGAHPECCDTAWDSICAETAREVCRPEIVPFNSSTSTGSSSIDSACPNGFVCDGNERMANCTELQLAAIELYGVGDVYGGIYCPLGVPTMLNCPIGQYCPTPEGTLPCPEGKFCPHKSRHPHLFECAACDEEAIELERDRYGYIVLVVLFAVAFVYLVLVMIKTYQNDLYIRLISLQQRQTDSLRNIMTRKQQRDEEILRRIRPKLEIIAARLARIQNSAIGDNDNDGPNTNRDLDGCAAPVITVTSADAINFDTLAMFQILDTNDDQFLSFDELNAVMELNRIELSEFIRRMNELDTTVRNRETVSKATFVQYFLQVLEETTHFTLSPEEAEDLFDTIACNGGQLSSKMDGIGGSIKAHQLYTSSISDYLTDAQINAIIKMFRSVNNHSASSERSDLHVNGPVISNNNITRADFVKHYPTFLERVTVDFEPSRVQQDLLAMSTNQPSVISAHAKLGVDICFQDLSLTVNVGSTSVNVVDHVSGRIQGQTMTALMGGSGAGKTSLLNALCGRAYYGETTGTLHINGHETSIDQIMDRVGFVPQDDIVYAELTVRENLIYAGKFRLPKGTPNSVIEELADDTMASLGLSRIANSMVGDVRRRGVSGGEKKRVNIGLELMACPSILFLDEPTSGLDSSSALLVMQSLRNLVDNQGMSIVSVIHQPRKFIFDLFDSLILLGVGGKMVYHGPVSQAQPYFERRNYVLPPGESLADWLIDISSGRMEPNLPDVMSSSVRATVRVIADGANEGGDDTGVEQFLPRQGSQLQVTSNKGERIVNDRGVTAGKQAQAFDDAKARRAWLYEEWKMHFASLPDQERDIYCVPDQYDLPASVTKASFTAQLYFQITRAMLVSRRNRFSKVLDTTVILGAMIVVAWMDGVAEATIDEDPELTFDQTVRPNHKNIEDVFYELFKYALVRHGNFAVKAGLIVAVLIGLQATKVITSKRVEFFREAASGYDLNAYFLAVNVVATLEHSLQVALASFFAIWMRNPFGSWMSYFIHFLLLTWISVSWALFMPQIVPPDNVVVVVGFFFTFCGLLLGGSTPPMTYKDMYEGGRVAELFSGWVSPLRFFVESMAVGEFRCMPEQSGLTVAADTLNFPRNQTALSISGMADHDINVTLRSCNGWYWAVLPSIFVGVTIRFAAMGAMHAFNRGKQTKKPLTYELRNNRRSLLTFTVYCICLLGLFIFTCWTMLRDAPVDDSIQFAEDRQDSIRDAAADCAETGSCEDPLDYFTQTAGLELEDLAETTSA